MKIIFKPLLRFYNAIGVDMRLITDILGGFGPSQNDCNLVFCGKSDGDNISVDSYNMSIKSFTQKVLPSKKKSNRKSVYKSVSNGFENTEIIMESLIDRQLRKYKSVCQTCSGKLSEKCINFVCDNFFRKKQSIQNYHSVLAKSKTIRLVLE